MSIDLIARTVRGIEYVVADEISTLSPGRLTMQMRQITFRMDDLGPGLTDLRTVDDLFVAVGSVGGVSHRKDAVGQLAEQARRWDWRRSAELVAATRDVPHRVSFDVVASLLGRRNYSRFDVEDAVGAMVADQLRGSYVSRRGSTGKVPAADLTVRVFLDADTATFALRLAAGPLHRRGYKQDASRGTLHPPMAAAMARLLAAGAGDVVVDPFCGDGTIPIETAVFSPDAEIHGSDADPERVGNARANARRAGVEVSFATADAGRLEFGDSSVNLLVTNPPWNVAVEASGLLADGLGPFWSETARVLSSGATLGLIMDADLDAATTVRSRGFEIALVQGVRLAGRLSQLVVCTPPRAGRWSMPEGIAEQRKRALASHLVTETGFESPARSR